MLFKFNSAEEVKAELFRLLEEIRDEKNAWKKVVIRKKKNGEEFVQISRAIDGARLSYDYNCHPEIEVVWSTRNKYMHSCLPAFRYLEARNEFIRNHGFIRNIELNTAEELREAIDKRIEQLEKMEKSYEKQIEICEKAFMDYRKAVMDLPESKLKEALEPAKYEGQIGECSLYYAITKTIC